jgi:hypothetical protein
VELVQLRLENVGLVEELRHENALAEEAAGRVRQLRVKDLRRRGKSGVALAMDAPKSAATSSTGKSCSPSIIAPACASSPRLPPAR